MLVPVSNGLPILVLPISMFKDKFEKMADTILSKSYSSDLAKISAVGPQGRGVL
jgi:hypothetical protein